MKGNLRVFVIILTLEEKIAWRYFSNTCIKIRLSIKTPTYANTVLPLIKISCVKALKQHQSHNNVPKQWLSISSNKLNIAKYRIYKLMHTKYKINQYWTSNTFRQRFLTYIDLTKNLNFEGKERKENSFLCPNIPLWQGSKIQREKAIV